MRRALISCTRSALRVCTRKLATERFLVTGALGQIGTELVEALRAKHGEENVIASDIRAFPATYPKGPWCFLDVTSKLMMEKCAVDNNVGTIVHLASLLSGTGEENPALAQKVNVSGIENALMVAKDHKMKIFAPSSIAVFGPSTPKRDTPDDTIMRPTTIYGVTKVYLELLGEYYRDRFGVDFRSLRYPGIISSGAMPGGGTTDYAVEIYHEALKAKKYECFLKLDTSLPMMYMPDCLDATVNLMEAPLDKLTQCTYNVVGMSFTPKDLEESIKKVMPDFSMTCEPDFRQGIAESWPQTIDDSIARRDWGWDPKIDVDGMTADMLATLKPKYVK